MQTDIIVIMRYARKQKANSTAIKLYSSDSAVVVYFGAGYERNMVA